MSLEQMSTLEDLPLFLNLVLLVLVSAVSDMGHQENGDGVTAPPRALSVLSMCDLSCMRNSSQLRMRMVGQGHTHIIVGPSYLGLHTD